eukprot:5080653-Pyramimonas_sp.AAC.1
MLPTGPCTRYWTPITTAGCSAAQAPHSDCEAALNNVAANSTAKAKGTVLRIRDRGQHATTIEARSGMLRHTSHVKEESFKRHNIAL